LVQATLPFLPKLIQSLVLVLYHSGARVGEIAKLTTGQIDMTCDPWIVVPDRHKTAHKNKSRQILLGPLAQKALKPWLLPDQPDEPIFSPLRVDPRQEKRQGQRLPGRFYGRSSLQQILRRGIARASVESWSLGMIRHNAAVRFADEFGLEVTRQLLGHTSIEMSRHYASEADREAREAAKKLG
jgi:integrase